MAEATDEPGSPAAGRAADDEPNDARQDGPWRGGQRRPPGPRPGRRRSRGLPRDRAERPDRRAVSRPTGPSGPWRPTPGTVVVLDFGSQFAQLITRRVRELDVFAELMPHDTPYDELVRRGTRAIILSGGPMSVFDPDAPRPDPAIWSGQIPVLGICYGAQMMALELGGDVLPTDRREYGPASVTITDDDGLFTGIDRQQPVWMSHGDSITRLPDGFRATAQTDSSPFAGLAAPERNLYGIQFHPEVVHTPERPRRPAQLRREHRGRRPRPGPPRTSSTRRSPASANGSTGMRPRRAPTGSSSAPCRAASTRRWRRRWSIGRSAIG